MIRKNLLSCKLLLTRHEAASALYRKQVKSFVPELEVCPCCGARGRCVPFCTYQRNVVDFIDGKPQTDLLEVERVQCESCNATHAILTDTLVPYGVYSLFFILRVIGMGLSGQISVEKICEYADISVSTYYRWLHQFNSHKEEWLGILESAKTSALCFYGDLLEMDPFSLFSTEFYKRTRFSFLQSHANPANCRYRPGFNK